MTKSISAILLLSQFVMMLALEMSNPFIPLLIAEQHLVSFSSVSFYSALALALPMIANILMTPVWGRVADRFGYKLTLIRAAWALVITQALMIFAHSMSMILIVRVLQGGFAGFIAAMQMYSLSAASWHSKGKQLSQLQAAKAFATSIAGAAGGFLLHFFDFQWLFLISTLLCLVTTLIMQFTLPNTSRQEHSQVTHRQTKLNHLVLTLGFLIICTQIVKFFPEPIFAYAFAQLMAGNTVMIGILYSLPATGLLIASTWCGKQFDYCRAQPYWIKYYLAAYCVLGACLMILHAIIANPFMLGLIRFLWGFVLAALLPAFFCLISDRYKEKPGYALGLANACAKTGNLVGVLLGGCLGGILTLNQVFLLLALVYGLMMLVNLCSNFDTRAQRTPELMPVPNRLHYE